MSEALKSSDEFDPLVCNPCILDGKTRPAHGFCDTCKEHLCQNCFQGHRVPSVLREHVMLDKESMPKKKVIPCDPLIEKCEKHGRLIEFYCKKHNAILCSVCVTLNHASCCASFIPDESKYVLNGQEFSRLRDNLSFLIEKVRRNKETSNGNKADIENLKQDTKSQIRNLKEDLIQFFEKLEHSLFREIDQIADVDLSRLNEISLSFVKLESDLCKMADNLDEKLKRNQINKLFVAMKNAEKKLPDIQSEIESKESMVGITRYWVEPEVKLEDIKSSVKAFGLLHTRRDGCKVSAKYVRDIKVRSSSDEFICWVSGLAVMSRERMVVCDCGINRSIKLIDMKRNKVVSQVQCHVAPRDIAIVPIDIAVESSTYNLIVTLPHANKLQFFRVVRNQITSTDKGISVNGECYGIQITRDRKLVVSFYGDPGKVEILDMNGHVLRRLQTDTSGIPLFCDPDYLAVSPCSGRIYVSDWRNKTLTTVRAQNGSVMSVLKGLRKPRGVTVDMAGSVFLCCCINRSVHQVTATGDRTSLILSEGNGLCEDPRAIVLSQDDRRMYISGCCSDNVQEFQLAEEEN